LHDADVAVVVLLDDEVFFLDLDDGVLVAEATDTVDEVEDVVVIVVVIIVVVIIVVVVLVIVAISVAISVIIVSCDERSTSSSVGGEFSNDGGSEDGLSSCEVRQYLLNLISAEMTYQRRWQEPE
jgi:ABC-type multidrug transport system fused ATPase/permease subunit